MELRLQTGRVEDRQMTEERCLLAAVEKMLDKNGPALQPANPPSRLKTSRTIRPKNHQARAGTARGRSTQISCLSRRLSIQASAVIANQRSRQPYPNHSGRGPSWQRPTGNTDKRVRSSTRPET